MWKRQEEAKFFTMVYDSKCQNKFIIILMHLLTEKFYAKITHKAESDYLIAINIYKCLVVGRVEAFFIWLA